MNYIRTYENFKEKSVEDYLKENNIKNDVTELDCSSNQLTSLKGIENLNNLTYLWCKYNPLKYPFWKEDCEIEYDDNQIKYFKSYTCQKKFLDLYPERVQYLKEFGFHKDLVNDPEYAWLFDQESNGFFGLK